VSDLLAAASILSFLILGFLWVIISENNKK